ncbi:MAG: thioredoxin domain-containing protein [Patescibacteria group bacterium]|nr:thioredoxin domain-containing protein [Patescibacteria group bacterium]
MFCILAFFILAILGIFSATHRELAKEAFKCVTKRVTFRPCDTGFKDKMQSHIVGTLITKSLPLAKFVNKNFELLSWIFFLTTIASIFWAGNGIYNFYIYGNCNGLVASGFCAFDPTGENNKSSSISSYCVAENIKQNNVSIENVDLSVFPTHNEQAENKIVFIGCYNCDYTRKAYPVVKKLLLENPNISYTFAHYPVKAETLYLLPIGYCAYKSDKEKYWQLNDILFGNSKEKNANPEEVDKILSELGYNLSDIKACTQSQETKKAIMKQRIELEKTGIYGTPLVFVNEVGLVGPKPYRVYNFMLNGIWEIKINKK